MKYYLQINEENIITDAIAYPHGDYTEVEIPMTQLPAGVNGLAVDGSVGSATWGKLLGGDLDDMGRKIYEKYCNN